MEKPSKLKVKIKDVDETKKESLAVVEEVYVEDPSDGRIISMEPTLGTLTSASEILVDESVIDSLENARLRSTERTNIIRIEAPSSNKDRKLSDSKLSSSKRSHKEVPKYSTSEVTNTDEYLIITLKASHRRELPKTKKSSGSFASESFENSTPSSKVKASDLKSYKTSNVTKLSTQPSNERIPASSESKSSKISSKHSKVSDEYSDCESSNTRISTEASNASSETIESYKAKTPIVLHDASAATTKHPDAEFYDEIRNHTPRTKWNNPVPYDNRYPIYYNPYRHFPYIDRSNSLRKKRAVKIPKKFSTFLLRVLKNKTEHTETKDINLKTERLTAKTQESRDPSTEETSNPISTRTRATQISTSLEKIEKNNFGKSAAIANEVKLFNPVSTLTSSPGPTDQQSSTGTTETLSKPLPSTSKNRHKYSTSASTADPLSTSTRIKYVDPLAPTSTAGTNPIQTHASSTEAEPRDPLAMNPIKFREKLRKLSHVESPEVQKKKTGSKNQTRALQKTRAEPTRDAKSGAISKIGSLPIAELSKNEEILIRTIPESGSVPKVKDSKREKAMTKEGEIRKHGNAPKDDSGGMPKVKYTSKIESIPTKETMSRDAAVQKSTSMSKCDIPSETEAIPKSKQSATSTVTVVPQDGSKFKTISKTQSAPKLRKGQYRDIPVIAYVRRFKKHPPKTNLDYYFPQQKDGWIRGYWRKFKYHKRIDSERQQSLLEKIVSSSNEIDLALQSAYNYSNAIEKLRRVTSNVEELLSYRNNKMKWLMSRLMQKTEIISDLLETIRCDVVLYTLETSASNDITSKRLYKLLKFLCGKQERKRKSDGKLTPVDEEEDQRKKS